MLPVPEPEPDDEPEPLSEDEPLPDVVPPVSPPSLEGFWLTLPPLRLWAICCSILRMSSL